MLETAIINEIIEKTKMANRDNITRTEAYAQFYFRHPEIQWSLLASIVSRNAGWNMCDLEGNYFPRVLSSLERKRIFLLYEKANWLIFSDAYPQLLLYEYSKQHQKPYFHLCIHFYISRFMEKEWQQFWVDREEKRLVKSLIMNEQYLIQQPIIEDTYFKQTVFRTVYYRIQEIFQFSYVIFPTYNGKLYGCSVQRFEDAKERVTLGYKLYSLLFHPLIYKEVIRFMQRVKHTGSRHDYEQLLPLKLHKDTPHLRDVYPVIPHQRTKKIVGVDGIKNDSEYLHFTPHLLIEEVTEHFLLKQQQLRLFISFQSILKTKEK